jgi:EAL domain-containing protein (putative c-di-GMP-specific phosphodiesterase class I)
MVLKCFSAGATAGMILNQQPLPGYAGRLTRGRVKPDAPASSAEFARLVALESYDILDTPVEEIFDDFVRLAASIIGTPVALVSLVDGNRQWFKAKVGLTITETPRDVAFCAHAIGSVDVFVIPDATKDPRFADNHLVTDGPKIRFYAGAPLITREGHAVGTLCVIDYVPRTFTSEQSDSLRCLSRLVMTQLDLRRRLAQFAHGLDPDGTNRVPLDIEITEGTLMENAAAAIGTLKEVQRLGVHISVDDFGTGYSSLRYLAHLPIDTLKIDRSFVAAMTESPDDMGVISSIISLAHGLNLNIVAEGVETEEQRKLLRLLRCDQMQGYFFTKPVPKDKMEEILRGDQQSATAEWQLSLRETPNDFPREPPVRDKYAAQG